MDGVAVSQDAPMDIHPTFPAADKACLISSYIRKSPFEDLDHVDNSFYCTPEDAQRFTDCSAHQVVMRFLKQIRESGGYDLDCSPPRLLCSPFAPFPLDRVHENEYMMNEYKLMLNLAENVALQKINSKTGCAYGFVDFVKVVQTNSFLVLLTFTAKQAGNTQEHTFRAIVTDPPPHEEKKLLEWRAKPVDAVAATADVDGWYMWNGHDFVPAPLYMWNGHDFVLCSSSTS